jgi:hypothetical protein
VGAEIRFGTDPLTGSAYPLCTFKGTKREAEKKLAALITLRER